MCRIRSKHNADDRKGATISVPALDMNDIVQCVHVVVVDTIACISVTTDEIEDVMYVQRSIKFCENCFKFRLSILVIHSSPEQCSVHQL